MSKFDISRVENRTITVRYDAEISRYTGEYVVDGQLINYDAKQKSTVIAWAKKNGFQTIIDTV